jgi:HEAT repeat protein
MRDPRELVESFGTRSGETRFASYEALVALGPDALPALREGLRSPSWQVRRWSAISLDRLANEEALADLVPLLTDPHPKVRLWAVHSLACDHCKDDVSCPIDVLPALSERALEDPDVRVRRMAVIMLGSEFVDARAVPVLERVIQVESDRKLREHAKRGLDRLGEALGPLA